MSDVANKYLSICNTFITNTASVRIRPVIMKMLKEEAESKVIALQNASEAYDRAARAYYNKHGTVGEY